MDVVTEMIYAASVGDLALVTKILAENATKVDVNQSDYDLRSPLHLAAAGGHAQVTSFLFVIPLISRRLLSSSSKSKPIPTRKTVGDSLRSAMP